jgi:hypothetical protein
MAESQFLVERQCPMHPRPVPSIESQLPVCLWVFLDERNSAPCGARSYPIDTRRGPVTAQGRTLSFKEPPPGARLFVCEHMGHLIE